MAELVEATPIDTEIDVMSKAELWLAQASELVAERCELYRPPKKVGGEAEYKQVTETRAQCRKDYQKIDDERKAMLKGIEDRLKQFKSEVKDVLSPLESLDVEYKRLIDEYMDEWREHRISELQAEYEALAPVLACSIVDEETGEIRDPLVPFDRLLARYGNETGSKWLGRSMNVMKAKGLVREAVDDIAKNEETIETFVPFEDQEEVKARYFSTLSINLAMEEARTLKEQRERVRAMEAVREEATQPEPEPQPNPQPAPEPVPPQPSTNYQPDAPHPWTISIPSATKQQMLMVADFMRSQGIEFNRIYAGTVVDAFRKEMFENA